MSDGVGGGRTPLGALLYGRCRSLGYLEPLLARCGRSKQHLRKRHEPAREYRMHRSGIGYAVIRALQELLTDVPVEKVWRQHQTLISLEIAHFGSPVAYFDGCLYGSGHFTWS